MNCTKPGLSIVCLYLLLFGFNRALVALNNDSRYGQRSIRSKFCYGQSSSAPKAKYLRSRTCRFKRRRLIGYILQPSLEEANRHELIACLFQSVTWLVNCWVQSWTKNHSQWSQIKFGVVILKETFNSLSPNIIIKFSWHVNTFRAFLVGKIC